MKLCEQDKKEILDLIKWKKKYLKKLKKKVLTKKTKDDIINI